MSKSKTNTFIKRELYNVYQDEKKKMEKYLEPISSKYTKHWSSTNLIPEDKWEEKESQLWDELKNQEDLYITKNKLDKIDYGGYKILIKQQK